MKLASPAGDGKRLSFGPLIRVCLIRTKSCWYFGIRRSATTATIDVFVVIVMVVAIVVAVVGVVVADENQSTVGHVTDHCGC